MHQYPDPEYQPFFLPEERIRSLRRTHLIFEIFQGILMMLAVILLMIPLFIYYKTGGTSLYFLIPSSVLFLIHKFIKYIAKKPCPQCKGETIFVVEDLKCSRSHHFLACRTCKKYIDLNLSTGD